MHQELALLKSWHIKTWASLGREWPDLKKVRTPRAKFDGRLKTTAGQCYVWKPEIYCSYNLALMRENLIEFEQTIVPHELAHAAAMILFKDDAHGKGWQGIMLSLGLEPEVFHTLTTKAQRCKIT